MNPFTPNPDEQAGLRRVRGALARHDEHLSETFAAFSVIADRLAALLSQPGVHLSACDAATFCDSGGVGTIDVRVPRLPGPHLYCLRERRGDWRVTYLPPARPDGLPRQERRVAQTSAEHVSAALLDHLAGVIDPGSPDRDAPADPARPGDPAGTALI